MDISTLKKNGILQWDSICTNYSEPDLLLGNGFSINFSDKLKYKSLFDNFIKAADSKYLSLFKAFDTTNFELILEYG